MRGGVVGRSPGGEFILALLAFAVFLSFPTLAWLPPWGMGKRDPPSTWRLLRCGRRGAGAVGRRRVFFMRYRRCGLPRA